MDEGFCRKLAQYLYGGYKTFLKLMLIYNGVQLPGYVMQPSQHKWSVDNMSENIINVKIRCSIGGHSVIDPCFDNYMSPLSG